MTESIKLPHIALIAAMDKNRLIGSNGRMPWHIPDDLAWFKAQTMGHIVMMGRRTWWSLSAPLPGRENVVMSRDPGFEAAGAVVLHGITEVLHFCGSRQAFVIGGADVFRQFLPLAEVFYQTLIDAEFEGDTWFPDWHPKQWELRSSNAMRTAKGLDISFNIYDRISS
jgi:dihydrofolate reductase